MNGVLRGRDRERGTVVMDAAAAVRHLEALGHDEPILIAYHPIARMNPYQSLLYSAAWEHGVGSVPLYDLAELEDLTAFATAAGVRLVLHLHWTNKILESAANQDEARLMLDRFVAQLDRFLARGGTLAWTVHNVLPHGAAMPALEAALQQAIVDRCSVVHVLSAQTPAAASEWFRIPEDKVLHVPHPNYIGAYVDATSRDAARWQLGISPDETVYSLVGAIKPYKGLTQLVDAFDAISRDPGGARRLIVAGLPSREPGVLEFLERCALHPFISLYPTRIAPDDMQLFLRAADLVVLPYLRSLNSGVLMLALSFGVPVVAPAVGSIGEILTPEIGRTFEPGDVDGLVDALRAADALRNPSAREAALRVAREYDAGRLSADFARGVAARVRAPAPTPV
ncbi:MAG TPA: glycosyltransferase family 4 protein [Candidatus Limnocylindrales bacterium]